ncbi:MAG: Lrp/AsnC family transcriptional regulator [Saprospiraceae bacterium]
MELKLDAIDQKLLMLLQQDCRMKIKDLAVQLNLSTTPTFERIKKLERAGIIDSYVAVLNPEKVGKKLNAYVHVFLKEHSKKIVQQFTSMVIEFPEVLECHYVTGGADFILKVLVNNIEEYNHFLLEKLVTIPNIGRTESFLSLSVEKKTTMIELRGKKG